MNNFLHTLEHSTLSQITSDKCLQSLQALEAGKVVYLPFYTFQNPLLKDKAIISESILDKRHKNISYNRLNKNLNGFNKKHSNKDLPKLLIEFMHDFSIYSKQLIDSLFPQYSEDLVWGRTSYRPVEINQRSTSKRKDDKRLHVDSFAATPVNGLRILRVFCNINPFGEPRVWHLGESFSTVMQRFATLLPNYSPLKARCLHWLKATKTLRSAYDHYQLHLHDRMKLDDNYQQTVEKFCFEFPPYSSWIVFTDQVSHAACRGQFLLEQTFYLPVDAQLDPETSPIRHWKKVKVLDPSLCSGWRL